MAAGEDRSRKRRLGAHPGEKCLDSRCVLKVGAHRDFLMDSTCDYYKGGDSKIVDKRPTRAKMA